MSDDQLDQLRRHLTVIHEHFAVLYNPAPDEPFAMEIEFKITSENILAIKQARPWVFGGNAAEGLVDEPFLPPTVTIAAKEGASSVTEGMAAEFTLTRALPTTAAMTVKVTVTQIGAVIQTTNSYQPPEEVTFITGDARTTLTVLTDDDGQQEEDGSVIATLQPGAGYTLGEAATQTAEVTVKDDDGTPIPPGPTGGGPGPVRQTVPSAPRNLLAGGGDGQVTLTWEAPEDDGGSAITDYEYRIDGKGRWISIGSTETTHTVTGLVNGQVYVFQVRAVNRNRKGRASNRVEATPRMPVALDFTHFANGAGTTSGLVFVNLEARPSGPPLSPFHTAIPPSRPAIYFYDTKGGLVAAESVVDLTEDLEVTEDGALTGRTEMEPLGVLTISTHGRGEGVSGSVKVVSDGPIGGSCALTCPASEWPGWEPAHR